LLNLTERVHIGPLALDSLTMREAVHRICSIASSPKRQARMVVTANAQFAQIAGSNHRFFTILRDAEIVVADGMSLVAASRMLGHPLPERIAGIDLVVELCREAARSKLSVYLLGGRPNTAVKAAENLRQTFPELRVAGVDCPSYGFRNDPAELAAVTRRILEAAPDILFVAFGAPKQEYWMEEHAAELPVKVMIGVGCSFDVLSGLLKRAPQWMQKTGLEWLFRVSQEPRRLWKRYMLGNTQLVHSVFREWLTRRRKHDSGKIGIPSWGLRK
jgi:N-acetylglucosaminyldiphosphoundecaprenol N-acetyl-beta-D-mannosaminyltransferase